MNKKEYEKKALVKYKDNPKRLSRSYYFLYIKHIKDMIKYVEDSCRHITNENIEYSKKFIKLHKLYLTNIKNCIYDAMKHDNWHHVVTNYPGIYHDLILTSEKIIYIESSKYIDEVLNTLYRYISRAYYYANRSEIENISYTNLKFNTVEELNDYYAKNTKSESGVMPSFKQLTLEYSNVIIALYEKYDFYSQYKGLIDIIKDMINAMYFDYETNTEFLVDYKHYYVQDYTGRYMFYNKYFNLMNDFLEKNDLKKYLLLGMQDVMGNYIRNLLLYQIESEKMRYETIFKNKNISKLFEDTKLFKKYINKTI